MKGKELEVFNLIAEFKISLTFFLSLFPFAGLISSSSSNSSSVLPYIVCRYHFIHAEQIHKKETSKTLNIVSKSRSVDVHSSSILPKSLLLIGPCFYFLSNLAEAKSFAREQKTIYRTI